MMELQQFLAADQVVLHGTFARADDVTPYRCDGAIFLHGAGGNFYNSSLLEYIVPACQRLGIGVLSANTRGHDSVCTLRQSSGGIRGGAAFELVDECRHDIRGAVDWLAAQGHQKIALIGHSLGALKALYSQACDPHTHVSQIVAISPPLLSFSAFSEGPRGKEFLTTMAQAQQLDEASEGDHLLSVAIPLPLLVSARTYIDKYGPSERYNLCQFASGVEQPVQYIFGGKEVSSESEAFCGLHDIVRRLGQAHKKQWTVDVVDGANHYYSGRGEALSGVISGWLRSDQG